MARDLPPFRPATLDELRTLWRKHPDPAIQRLVLEVVRSREVIAEVDHLYKTIHQAWRGTVGGNLTALHLLQKLLDTERERLAF
jgi:hypothetical protein